MAKFSQEKAKTVKSLRAIAIVALFFTPIGASAATVSLPDAGGGTYSATLVATGSAAWSGVDQSKSSVLPKDASWTVAPAVLPNATYGIAPGEVADPCMYACSPFYSGVLGAPTSAGAAGWETTPFFTVFDTHDSVASTMQQAVLTFSRAQTALSILWGTPDYKNLMEFSLGGKVIASFWGADFNWFWETDPGIVTHPGAGAALLKLSGFTFDSVRFATWSDTGSFEFSNITASPVPLPPAILALFAAVGSLVVISRRRA